MIRNLLEGGGRRSLGRSGDVVNLVSARPGEFPELIALLWDADPVVRMRAADAAEKITRLHPALLQGHKRELLGLLHEVVQQEVRWHLALMIPRLKLTAPERRQVCDAFERYLEDDSSIVKTHAMQGLADLAKQDADLQSTVIEQIGVLTRTGTPAMKARGRKLLIEIAKKKS